jgi:pimeloyl-ACP methyl ester carboxylesterase
VDPVLPRRALRIALVGVACLSAACTSAADPQAGPSTSSTTAPAPSTTAAPATTTTVALPSPVPIEWAPCGGGFDCATVTVPVDYLDPTGPTLDLALTRRPAGDPEQRIGSVLVNPGGPGASGVRRVQRGFRVSDEVAARFDIVGFDPRGIGASTPVTCGATVAGFRATDLDPDGAAEEEALVAAAQAVAEECEATEGARLAHLGTLAVARDVEVIRGALGEDRISFVGLSYGTLIGQLWAELYPGSVRALVLDGVVDPATGGAGGGVEQAEAVERTTRAIDAACATDPSCPLTATGGVLAAYDQLAARIEAGEGAPVVGPTQLAYALIYATYGEEQWPRLYEALADGLAGDLAGVRAMADAFTGLVAYTPFALVSCLDDPHPVGYAAWKAAADEQVDAGARLGRVIANELLPCAFWPAGPDRPREIDAEGTPPILVIGSTGDAATPYAQAVRVADRLAAGALLTVDIEGHVALGDSACADEVATRYLVDLALPAPDRRC